MDGMRRRFGADHAETLRARHDLCITLAREGEFDRAISDMRLIVDSKSRTSDSDDPELKKCQEDLETMVREKAKKQP